MQNEQIPADYLQTNQLQPRKKINKWLIVGIASAVFILLISGIALLATNKEKASLPTAETEAGEISVEQRFVNNLESGNAEALMNQNSVFQDKESAVTTIDWLQVYLSLENCEVEQKTDNSEFNGESYYQAILGCPLQTSSGKPGKNKRFMALTFKGDDVVYLDVSDVMNKHAGVAELAEAFRW